MAVSPVPKSLEAVGGQDIQGAQSLLEQVGGPADLEHDDGIALLFIGAELAERKINRWS